MVNKIITTVIRVPAFILLKFLSALLGRLAEYKYYNIDAMCRKAMDLAEEIG